MRRSTNILLAGILVAVAVAGAAVAGALPSPGGGSGVGAEEPYTSRWLCPVVPKVDGNLTIANIGTKDALLRATMRWDGTSTGVVAPPKTTEPPKTTKAAEGTGSTGTTRPVSQQSTTTTSRPPQTSAGQGGAGGQAGPAGGDPQHLSRQVAVGQPLKPGEVRTVRYGATDKVPSLLEVESFGAPVAVNGSGQPACAPGAATRWWLPTADVPQNGDTRIVIANPGEDGATVRVTLHTTVTRYDPSGLKQLFIPGRSARILSVASWLPSSPEQAVQIQALFGTVVVGALTTESRGDSSPSIIPAQWGSPDHRAFAGGLSGEAGQTTLLLTNPGETSLKFDVDVVTDKKTIPLPNADDFEVPAGTMQSIAVGVDVNGPIGLVVRSRTGDVFGAGLRVTTNAGQTYVDAGGSGDDQRWILPRPGKPPIAVANYGDKPLSFSIDDLAGGDTGQGGKLAPNRIAYLLELPKVKGGLVIRADEPGLVVRTAGDLQAIPGEWVGGLPANGQVRPGPAAG